MKKKRCKHCGCLFVQSSRHPNQKYCTKEKCQKARKAKWQRDKLANDGAYRQNQKDCRDQWLQNNPDYWKNYRNKNPAYAKRNREMQRERNRTKRSRNSTESILSPIANMDASDDENNKISGRYQLIPCKGQKVANMDVIIVEIRDITASYVHGCKI